MAKSRHIWASEHHASSRKFPKVHRTAEAGDRYERKNGERQMSDTAVTDYDESRVAEQYKECKLQSWRVHLEDFSFQRAIGDVSGLKLVDLACGEGHVTRRIATAGAKDVYGVDVSQRMVELARKEEVAQPLGITYKCEKVGQEMISPQNFDLATAAWLLVYCRNRKELADMCKGVAQWVKPGGRFVTLITTRRLQKPFHAPNTALMVSQFKLKNLQVTRASCSTTLVLQRAAPLELRSTQPSVPFISIITTCRFSLMKKLCETQGLKLLPYVG